MCASYWSMFVDMVACPKCGDTSKKEFQTHFRGEDFGCENFFKLGDAIPPFLGLSLAKFTIVGDYFVSSCGKCDAMADWDAEIKDGVVVKVWPIRFSFGRGDSYKTVNLEEAMA